MNKKSTKEEQRLAGELFTSKAENARLDSTLLALDALLDVFLLQAHAQFKVGDTHATFNKQTIAAVEKELELLRSPLRIV